MKLTVYETSMFDFSDMEEGGLIFEVEQVYAEPYGFYYLAESQPLPIVISYKSAESFNEQLNDEISYFYQYYSALAEDKMASDALEFKKFCENCFTIYKK